LTGWGAAVALLLALGALAYVHFRERPPLNEMVRFEFPAPAGAIFADGSDPAVSPDGRKIAFVATGADRKPMLWVRSLDTGKSGPWPEPKT
jgi:hypothetical protein